MIQVSRGCRYEYDKFLETSGHGCSANWIFKEFQLLTGKFSSILKILLVKLQSSDFFVEFLFLEC